MTEENIYQVLTCVPNIHICNPLCPRTMCSFSANFDNLFEFCQPHTQFYIQALKPWFSVDMPLGTRNCFVLKVTNQTVATANASQGCMVKTKALGTRLCIGSIASWENVDNSACILPQPCFAYAINLVCASQVCREGFTPQDNFSLCSLSSSTLYAGSTVQAVGNMLEQADSRKLVFFCICLFCIFQTTGLCL